MPGILPDPQQAQRLRSIIGGYTDNDVVERLGMLPFGKYSDGKVRMAWPEAIATPARAIWDLDKAGTPNIVSDPQGVADFSRQSFDAASVAPMGGVAASVAGAVPEGAVAANGIGARIKGLFGKGVDETPDWQAIVEGIPHGTQPDAVQGQPFKARMYRGEQFPDDPGRDMSGGLFASSSPAEASSFAAPHGPHSQPRVTPLDVEFQNPYVVDKNGANWETHYDDLAKARDLGHDGLVMRNIVENLAPNTTSIALKPGTVRSATTGDLLYSNSPTGASVPLAMGAAENGWGQRLQAFRERLPQATEANDFTVESPFPYVGLNDLPPGSAQFMDGAKPRGQETVNLSDLVTHQRGVFGPNVEGIAKTGADGWTYDGRPLNAPTVYKLPTGELLLQDGNHRLSAAALNGDKQAIVDMLYANSGTGASVPLAFNDYEDRHPKRRTRGMID